MEVDNEGSHILPARRTYERTDLTSTEDDDDDDVPILEAFNRAKAAVHRTPVRYADDDAPGASEHGTPDTAAAQQVGGEEDGEQGDEEEEEEDDDDQDEEECDEGSVIAVAQMDSEDAEMDVDETAVARVAVQQTGGDNDDDDSSDNDIARLDTLIQETGDDSDSDAAGASPLLLLMNDGSDRRLSSDDEEEEQDQVDHSNFAAMASRATLTASSWKPAYEDSEGGADDGADDEVQTFAVTAASANDSTEKKPDTTIPQDRTQGSRAHASGADSDEDVTESKLDSNTGGGQDFDWPASPIQSMRSRTTKPAIFTTTVPRVTRSRGTASPSCAAAAPEAPDAPDAPEEAPPPPLQNATPLVSLGLPGDENKHIPGDSLAVYPDCRIDLVVKAVKSLLKSYPTGAPAKTHVKTLITVMSKWPEHAQPKPTGMLMLESYALAHNKP